MLVEKAYAEINGTGQPELDWICGFGCVLRPADWDPKWGSWTLSWGTTEGGQVEELRVYLDPLPVRDESTARQLRYVRARRS